MADIKKDSVQKYVKDLISDGFKAKDNKEKSFACDLKSTIDEEGSFDGRIGRKNRFD
jgi:hypothetical protein